MDVWPIWSRARCARSSTKRQSSRCWRIGRTLRFARWAKDLGSIIRQCSAVSSGRWSMARWEPSTIARDRARNQPSRLRPKPGWCRWRATRRRTTAIHMSCGRRDSWRAGWRRAVELAMSDEEIATLTTLSRRIYWRAGCRGRLAVSAPPAPSGGLKKLWFDGGFECWQSPLYRVSTGETSGQKACCCAYKRHPE